jgi:hypothetical protein
MVTILKFAVYVQVETESIDRGMVSKVVKEILHPQLLQYLGKASIKSEVMERIALELRSPVSISMLTEVDLINRLVSRESPQAIKVNE